MLKSYKAIYDHGRLIWLGDTPTFKRMRVVIVADDENELMSKDANLDQPNGAKLVEILHSIPTEILKSISDKFGDPLIWESEQRQERLLPGRN